jgi:hypothetical protein
MRPKEREPPGGQAQLDGLGTHSVPMNVEATKSLATALSLFSPISNPKTSFL